MEGFYKKAAPCRMSIVSSIFITVIPFRPEPFRNDAVWPESTDAHNGFPTEPFGNDEIIPRHSGMLLAGIHSGMTK